MIPAFWGVHQFGAGIGCDRAMYARIHKRCCSDTNVLCRIRGYGSKGEARARPVWVDRVCHIFCLVAACACVRSCVSCLHCGCFLVSHALTSSAMRVRGKQQRHRQSLNFPVEKHNKLDRLERRSSRRDRRTSERRVGTAGSERLTGRASGGRPKSKGSLSQEDLVQHLFCINMICVRSRVCVVVCYGARLLLRTHTRASQTLRFDETETKHQNAFIVNGVVRRSSGASRRS